MQAAANVDQERRKACPSCRRTSHREHRCAPHNTRRSSIPARGFDLQLSDTRHGHHGMTGCTCQHLNHQTMRRRHVRLAARRAGPAARTGPRDVARNFRRDGSRQRLRQDPAPVGQPHRYPVRPDLGPTYPTTSASTVSEWHWWRTALAAAGAVCAKTPDQEEDRPLAVNPRLRALPAAAIPRG